MCRHMLTSQASLEQREGGFMRLREAICGLGGGGGGGGCISQTCLSSQVPGRRQVWSRETSCRVASGLSGAERPTVGLGGGGGGISQASQVPGKSDRRRQTALLYKLECPGSTYPALCVGWTTSTVDTDS